MKKEKELIYKYDVGYYYTIGKTSFKILDRKIVRGKDGKRKKMYYVECQNCGDKKWKDEKYIYQSISGVKKISGQGCRNCNQRYRASNENCIAVTDSWMIPLLNDVDDAYRYSSGSGQKIWFKCPHCGELKLLTVKQVHRDHRICCSKCGDGFSYPNKFGYSLLKQLKIDFISEYSDDWTDGHRYDFYFSKNNVNYLLEMDGFFHFEDGFNNSTLKRNQEADKTKDELAKENNYILIRVDCYKSDFEYIKKNVFCSNLSNVLDLSNVNWNALEKDCLKNKIVEVCKYYVSNPGITKTRMGEIFNLNPVTISIYLGKGADCGIIDYKKPKVIYEENYNKVVNYRNENKTIKEICELTGLHDHNVRSYISKAIINGDILDHRTDMQRKKDAAQEIIRNEVYKNE